MMTTKEAEGALRVEKRRKDQQTPATDRDRGQTSGRY